MFSTKIKVGDSELITFGFDNYYISEGTAIKRFLNVTFIWDDMQMGKDEFERIVETLQELTSLKESEKTTVEIENFVLEIYNLTLNADYDNKFITIGWESSEWI